MTDPGSSESSSIYFDGTSNRKRRVTLRVADRLEIIEAGNVVAAWPYSDIRHADGAAGVMRLRSVSALPLARLEIADPTLADAIRSRCRLLDTAQVRTADTARIVLWSIAAVASIVGLVVLGIPLVADRIVALVPAALDRRVGEAVDGNVRAIFGGKTCNNPAGEAAFRKLLDKTGMAGGLAVAIDAQVLASPVPNAFALPGGKVYVLDGLLQRANNADELAGVIAHELGHVASRDGLRKMIQVGGTSFLVGLLFGDVMGSGAVIFAARSLLDASHSRAAEQAADAFAISTMHKLGRSPRPLGELLVRMTGSERNRTFGLFATHPLSDDRLAEMGRLDRPNTGEELLSAGEWAALKAICKTP